MTDENSTVPGGKNNPAGQSAGLVDGPRLLEVLFPNVECRPSIRWLRNMQKGRAIPFIKLGHLVFFDPAAVLRALEQRHTIRPRWA
jgi:hypothetical protein